MSKPQPTPEPTAAEIGAIEIPTAQKTFKLDHAVDRHIRRGSKLPEGKGPKLSEVVLRPLRWVDILDLPLTCGGLDHGDLIDVAAKVAGESPRTFDELALADTGRLIDYVSRSLLPLAKQFTGQDVDDPDEYPEIHDGSAPVSISVKTPKAQAAGEALEEITIPKLKAVHIRGYPLDPSRMSFQDARDIIGKATGFSDGVFDRLELEDVGNLIAGLLGFLLGLRAT